MASLPSKLSRTVATQATPPDEVEAAYLWVGVLLTAGIAAARHVSLTVDRLFDIGPRSGKDWTIPITWLLAALAFNVAITLVAIAVTRLGLMREPTARFIASLWIFEVYKCIRSSGRRGKSRVVDGGVEAIDLSEASQMALKWRRYALNAFILLVIIPINLRVSGFEPFSITFDAASWNQIAAT